MDNRDVALNITGLCKRFGGRKAGQTVLQDLELRVGAGEFFGLVGMNGAGKTTCIKTILDFSGPDAGEIEIFGNRHLGPQARDRLAYLPEHFLPPYFQTGEGFLRHMARLHRQPADTARFEQMYALLDLPMEALHKPVREYSKGMAQKLGLAGCFLSGKDLFILDEPMSGLDPKSRVLVKRQLTKLRAQGSTVFFSTHMLFDVQELCDRVGVLHDGRLQFVGTPSECCARFNTGNLEEAYLRCIGGETPSR